MAGLTGIVGEWTSREYGGRFESLDLSTTVGTSAAVVAQNDPERVAIMFVNLSVNIIYLRMAGVPSSTVGIPLAPQGGALTLNMLEDLTLPSMQWQAVASGAGSQLACYASRRYLKENAGGN